MIRSMSLLTTELAYALSMLISAMLLTRCVPMVLRRYVFNRRSALNDRSTEHDIAGIAASICTTLENSGNISNRSSRALSLAIHTSSDCLARDSDLLRVSRLQSIIYDMILECYAETHS